MDRRKINFVKTMNNISYILNSVILTMLVSNQLTKNGTLSNTRHPFTIFTIAAMLVDVSKTPGCTTSAQAPAGVREEKEEGYEVGILVRSKLYLSIFLHNFLKNISCP